MAESINTKKLKGILKNKKFINILEDTHQIRLTLNNVLLPFGTEKYNDKNIINIELEKDNNTHNNYISILDSIENKVKNKEINLDINALQNLINKTFLPTMKTSKLGYLLRTHLLSSTEIFILKKNNDKLLIDSSNLNNSTCNLSLLLKGMWITESNYGLYWEINSIQVLSFKS